MQLGVPMTFDLTLIAVAVLLGAILQVGTGIGFSIIAGPPAMVILGTSVAVPILLLLNTIVSAVATDWKVLYSDRRVIVTSIIGCLIGIGLGWLTYSLLSEAVVLGITATLLLIGVVTTLFTFSVKTSGFVAVSGLSGLATIWAATPGPLMVFGLLALGRSPNEVRRLVQPIALVAYGVSLLFYGMSGWQIITTAPALLIFVIATILGSLIGRLIGPYLPREVIVNTVRVISIFACITLYRRALTLL